MFSFKPLFFTRSSPEGVLDVKELDASSQLILYEAEKIGIQWRIVPDTEIIELNYNNKIQYFRKKTPSTNSSISAAVCREKFACKVLLQRANINVVSGFTIYKDDSDIYIESLWKSLQKPLVLKPSQGTEGKGVEVNLTKFSDCLNKVREYFESPLYEGGLILEEMFIGSEYRILATREKVMAVMERKPAFIVGDGEHSVKDLVELENNNSLRNIAKTLYPHIILDSTSKELLDEQGLDLTSIPAKDQLVRLKRVSNISVGGVAIDRTDEIHESVREIALQAVQAIPGLMWAGIDFMTKDIFAPQSQTSYVIIEINSAPEFDMHDIPMQGKSRGITKEFLYIMFPELRNS